MTFINKILNLFKTEGFLNEADLNEIKKSIPEEANVFDYVVEKKYCSSIQATQIMAKWFDIPYYDLRLLAVDRSLLQKFSQVFLKKHNFLPIRIDDNGEMMVAISHPLDYISMTSVRMIFDGKVNFVLVPHSQLNERIRSFTATSTAARALDTLSQTANQAKDTVEAVREDVENAPAVRLVDAVIKEAIPMRASDIHIEPYEKVVRIRYRIDGSLIERASFPIESYPAICARIKILASINIAERRIPQDGRIEMQINGIAYDIRVSTLPTVNGEKFVLRILDKTSFAFTREELGFTAQDSTIIDKILNYPHGIVLLTGPTGCGKSTTLYAFLKELNSSRNNIVTVEDPVEYTMEGINQTQVNTKANMTFASALRSILRQDPNIIMIGEIRDEETAQIAIRAAITGHLVFSTLHTNNAHGSINRLVNMGIPPYLVADSLVSVIAQRLVKKLCPQCKEQVTTSEREMRLLKLDQPTNIYKAHGCPFCNGTGYKGRIAVHEIMYMNSDLRAAIEKGESADTIRAICQRNGMHTLWENGRRLVLEGITGIDALSALSVEE